MDFTDTCRVVARKPDLHAIDSTAAVSASWIQISSNGGWCSVASKRCAEIEGWSLSTLGAADIGLPCVDLLLPGGLLPAQVFDLERALVFDAPARSADRTRLAHHDLPLLALGFAACSVEPGGLGLGAPGCGQIDHTAAAFKAHCNSPR
jgi:hypothetical protein